MLHDYMVCYHVVLATFSRMRAWGRGALLINKMAGWLSLEGYAQICVARGKVCWGSEGNGAAGELQLWYNEGYNHYCLYARKTRRDEKAVCKVIDVFILFTSKSVLTK